MDICAKVNDDNNFPLASPHGGEGDCYSTTKTDPKMKPCDNQENEEMEWSVVRPISKPKRRMEQDTGERRAKISVQGKKDDAITDDATDATSRHQEEIIEYRYENRGPYKVWIFPQSNNENVSSKNASPKINAFKIRRIIEKNIQVRIMLECYLKIKPKLISRTAWKPIV